jgi:hypothetical protein
MTNPDRGRPTLLTDLVLGMVYFGVVTPVGWLSRLIRDPLSRRRNRRATTYWVGSARR